MCHMDREEEGMPQSPHDQPPGSGATATTTTTPTLTTTNTSPTEEDAARNDRPPHDWTSMQRNPPRRRASLATIEGHKQEAEKRLGTKLKQTREKERKKIRAEFYLAMDSCEGPLGVIFPHELADSSTSTTTESTTTSSTKKKKKIKHKGEKEKDDGNNNKNSSTLSRGFLTPRKGISWLRPKSAPPTLPHTSVSSPAIAYRPSLASIQE